MRDPERLLTCPPGTPGRDDAARWLRTLVGLGRAPNTVAAYARGISAYLAFCVATARSPLDAGLEHVSLFVGHLRGLPGQRGPNVFDIGSGCGLSTATLQQRLCAVRLWYDYLKFEGKVDRNPVPRGHRPMGPGSGRGRRGLIQGQTKLPKIPSDTAWRSLCDAVRTEPARNRLMFSLAYSCALRREELVSLRVGDVDAAGHLVTVRAETTKTKRGRVVPYQPEIDPLLGEYLAGWRGRAARGVDRLFLSDSPRNRGEGLTPSSWSKVVERIRDRARVAGFSTHTLRHLRLTHLARGDMKAHELAAFAGHKSVTTTLIYLHLTGRDLAQSVASASERLALTQPIWDS